MKKVIALFLVFVMTALFVPFASAAEEADRVVLCGYIEQYSGRQNIFDSSSFSSLQSWHEQYWVLYGDGTLVYAGTGEIPDNGEMLVYEEDEDYRSGSTRGAFVFPDSYMDDASLRCPPVRKIVVEEGITKIGQGVFETLFHLEEVELPSSLVEIGDEAFAYCTSLKKVTFSEGLKIIGERAFYQDSSLEAISLPSTLESVAAEAFSGVARASGRLVFPASLTNVGEDAFCLSQYGIRELYVLNDNLDFQIQYEGSDTVHNIIRYEMIGCSLSEAEYDELMTLMQIEMYSVDAYPDIRDHLDEVPDDYRELCRYLVVQQYGENCPALDYLDFMVESRKENDLKISASSYSEYHQKMIELFNSILGTDFHSLDEILEPRENWDTSFFVEAVRQATYAKYGVYDLFDGSEMIFGATPSTEDDAMIKIYGHGGAKCEAFADGQRIPFVCLHAYNDQHLCVYCGAHTAPVWSAWTAADAETHSRYDTEDPAYTETEAHVWDGGAPGAAAGETVYRCTVCGETKTEAAASGQTVLTDAATGVSITYDGGTYAADVKLIVKEDRSAADARQLQTAVDNVDRYLIYDISTASGSEVIQPKNTVEVRIPIPAGFDRKSLVVYYLPDGAKPEQLPFSVEGDSVCFTVRHFSKYAVVSEKAAAQDAAKENPCKWCGKDHTGFFGKIIRFFHSILYFFAHLFHKK